MYISLSLSLYIYIYYKYIYIYPPTLVQRSSVLDSLFINLSIQWKTLDTLILFNISIKATYQHYSVHLLNIFMYYTQTTYQKKVTYQQKLTVGINDISISIDISIKS